MELAVLPPFHSTVGVNLSGAILSMKLPINDPLLSTRILVNSRSAHTVASSPAVPSPAPIGINGCRAILPMKDSIDKPLLGTRAQNDSRSPEAMHMAFETPLYPSCCNDSRTIFTVHMPGVIPNLVPIGFDDSRTVFSM